MFYSNLNNPNKQRIEEMYSNDPTQFEKGKHSLPIGSRSNWGGKDWIKTAEGWKEYHSKPEVSKQSSEAYINWYGYGTDRITRREIANEMDIDGNSFCHYPDAFCQAVATGIKIKRLQGAIANNAKAEIKKVKANAGSQPDVNSIQTGDIAEIRNFLQWTFSSLAHGKITSEMAGSMLSTAEQHLELSKIMIQKEIAAGEKQTNSQPRISFQVKGNHRNE